MMYLMQNLVSDAILQMRQQSRLTKAIINHPLNSFGATATGKSMASWLTVFENLCGGHAKPEWGISEVDVDGHIVKVTDEVVLHRAYCNIVHFKKHDLKTKQPRLFIVAPMSGHFATLLRGTVQALLPYYDIYITDWIDCKHVSLKQDRFNLNDFIDYIIDFLHFLGPHTHMMSVCQPTVAALSATAIMSDWNDKCLPESLVLVAGPIDTRVNPTMVNKFAKSKDIEWFKENLIQVVPPPFIGMGRKVYPGFFQLNSFMAMNPDRHKVSIESMYEALVKGDDEQANRRKEFYDEYLAVMDLPEEFYIQTIEEVFQKHSLPLGKLMSRWHAVDTHHIKKPYLLVIEGEEDDICGVGQTKAALDITPNLPAKHKQYELIKGVGHYGTFNGGIFRKQIVPIIRKFIDKAAHHQDTN